MQTVKKFKTMVGYFLFGIVCLWGFISPLQAEDKPKYSIQIVSPQPGETFQNSTQELPVTVQVSPPLKADDTIVILVDGQQVTEPSKETTISTPWLPRGEHTVQAKVIQKEGPGAESQAVTFFQQRSSSQLPAPSVNSQVRGRSNRAP